MSWLKIAVNRAVIAGGNGNIRRNVWSVADAVVQQAGNAVTGGAKLIQDRIASRSLKSFRQTVKRLEEVSVSCKGIERVQMLRRWLVALKEIDRLTAFGLSKDSKDQLNSDEAIDSSRKPTLVYYADPDMDCEPRNFRDVFLYSQALEGIIMSMILEEPAEEEVSLLLEIFGLCLAGGKEVHNAVMSSIWDLATAFSKYKDEVLVKREELLRYAQGAIAGLKINADLSRIDAEASSIKEKLDKIKPIQQQSNEGDDKLSEEDLKEALGQIQLCSKLEELLVKKKSLSNGDSPEFHAEKVHKLKIFVESLANSTSQAERRILDHRSQKEEAVNFRLAKAKEIGQLEKELAVEIQEFEKKKDELESELKKVCTSLAVSRARLRNAREEREQFDNASNEILMHLKSKEDELSRSSSSCKKEANVVDTWINFLEDTWNLQTAQNDMKEKQVNDDLVKCGDRFVSLVIRLLSAYKEQLALSITNIHKLVEKLRLNEGSEIALSRDKESPKKIITRKSLEEEYLNLEGKFIKTLSIVDAMQKQFFMPNEDVYRKEIERVKELFDALAKIKEEYESIERPNLRVETPTGRPQSPLCDKNSSPSSSQFSETQKNKQEKISNKKDKVSDVTAELERLDSGSGRSSRDDNSDEIIEWEFDALDKDLHISG
ncbi:polyamine-modulated factor 1-binding protein 1-like isoform X1 [Mangifera indica]|uniref:polyamine-modulated factor 1-binding protein 1-like isoform X1 n=1 Tax=Mangifera indica TaxID=29780 RepID=UPI001CFA2E81|nr:polyamine-modulated factor 1-binding protein 1-like isoform X1 [Mangifera indica]